MEHYEADLNKHLDKEDERAKQLEYFHDDIDLLKSEIIERADRIKEIARESYPNLDLDSEIKSIFKEMLWMS